MWYVCDVLYAVMYCMLICSAWMCCLEEVYKCLQYLLPTVYLFMADIANPDLFV